MTHAQVLAFENIHKAAHEAGLAGAMAARPTPMHVTDGTTVYRDEGARPGVNAGACGFAWVEFPGTIAFARWAKTRTMADMGRPDMKLASKHYPSGYCIWAHWIPREIDYYGQSVDIKYAYAVAYAKVLREHGIEAHAGSRLD